MTPPRERLRDAASILATYDFDINHREEQGTGLNRNVTRTAPTSGVGFVRQQGAGNPAIFRFSGTILKQAHYAAIRAYYDACESRTVFFKDYTGTEYEVLITGFDTTRVAVAKNPREPGLMHIWKYTLEMEVVA